MLDSTTLTLEEESKHETNHNHSKISTSTVVFFNHPNKCRCLYIHQRSNRSNEHLSHQWLCDAGWVSFTSIHYSKSRFHLKEIGFRKGSLGMWIFPILIIEAIPFIAGLNKDLTLSSFIALCFFMVCVGLFEEGIFRGILFQYLKQINLSTAIWGSAVLFGLGHSANLLSGKILTLTVTQIIFAFLFGFVAAEIVALTNSLQWVVLWHAVHNIVDQMTSGQTPMAMQMLLLSFQCVILLVLAVVLWRRLRMKKVFNR